MIKTDRACGTAPRIVSFAPHIAPGVTGVYDHKASTGPIDFGDFGVSPLYFQIFMNAAGGAASKPPAVQFCATSEHR